MKTNHNPEGFLSQYKAPKGFDHLPIQKQWDSTYNFLRKEKNKEILDLIIEGLPFELIKERCNTSLKFIETIKQASIRKVDLEKKIDLEKLNKFLEQHPDVIEQMAKGKSQMAISEMTGLAYGTVNKVSRRLQKRDQILNNCPPNEKKKVIIDMSIKEAEECLQKHAEVVEYLEQGFSRREIKRLIGTSPNTTKKVDRAMKKLQKQKTKIHKNLSLAEVEEITQRLEFLREQELEAILQGNFEEWKKSDGYEKKVNLDKLGGYAIDELLLDFEKYLETQKEEIPSELLEKFKEEVLWKSEHVQNYKEFRFPNIFPFTEDDWKSAINYYRNGLVEWEKNFLGNYPKKLTKTTENKKIQALKEYLITMAVSPTEQLFYGWAMESFLKKIKRKSDKALMELKKKRYLDRIALRKNRKIKLKEISIEKSQPTTNLVKFERIPTEEEIIKSKRRILIEKWENRKKSLQFQLYQEEFLRKILNAGIDPWSKEWDKEEVPEKFLNLYYKCSPLSEYWLEDRELLLSLRKIKVRDKLQLFDEAKARDLLTHLDFYHRIYLLDEIYLEANEGNDYPNKQIQLKF